ncbi:hypothetical protein ACLOJK_039556 [Asimina triloba]
MTSAFQTPLILPLEDEENIIQELNVSLLPSLPKEEKGQVLPRYHYKGFWYSHKFLLGMLICRKYFKARDCDVVLSILHKSSTTWLKALSFSIINRARYPRAQQKHPLLTSNPHQLVPFLEINLYVDNRISHLYSAAPSPALVSTHLAYSALPESTTSVEILEMFWYLIESLAIWHFASRIKEYKTEPSQALEDAFEMFCAGVFICGPYWDHVLQYWKASLENPEKVLCLRFEDLKRDEVSQLKRLADFLGHPFPPEEEDEGGDGGHLAAVQLQEFEQSGGEQGRKDDQLWEASG